MSRTCLVIKRLSDVKIVLRTIACLHPITTVIKKRPVCDCFLGTESTLTVFDKKIYMF